MNWINVKGTKQVAKGDSKLNKQVGMITQAERLFPAFYCSFSLPFFYQSALFITKSYSGKFFVSLTLNGLLFTDSKWS